VSESPVVIIGAGPTGVTAAALLARYGVRSIVLEREADIARIPRAVHLDEESVRMLHLAGLGEAVAPVLRPIRGMKLVTRERETLIDFAREGQGSHGFARSNAFDQPELEQAMRGGLAGEPLVSLRSSTSVEAVEHLPDGRLRVTYRELAGGGLGELEAAAVLACDGARSRTRAYVGTDFEDLGFDARWLVVDVLLDEPLEFYDGCLQVADPERPTTYYCTGGGRHRWEIMLRDDEDPERMVEDDAVRGLLRPWLGAATERATLRRRAVYRFHSLVARTWRRGNVFLLGDAAHQTPPFIGQGLAAGVRDAANLCWKLAAVLKGRANPALLDTYQAERRPHVHASISQAVLLGRTMQTKLGGPLREVALAGVGRLDMARDRLVAMAFPPLTAGPIVLTKANGSSSAGGHVPRAVVSVDGRRTHLDEVLAEDFALLVAEARGAGGPAQLRIWRAPHDATGQLVLDVDGTLTAWLASLAAEAALVRPDRVVMACGKASHSPRWLAALSALGAPAPRAAASVTHMS
jgi:3-(3-hydroxy-phenyl)propionate hydroxylase